MQGKEENITKTIHRLQEYITNKGISFNKLAIELGLSNSYFSKMVKNGGSIGSDVIEKILRIHTDINANWLLTGQGDMLKIEEKPIKSPRLSLPSMDDNFIRIPVVDIAVAAGTGYCNPDYIEEVECISMPRTMIKNGCTYLCVRVKGQSMMPSILDGGYLVVRLMERHEWSNIRDNYVYVVSDRDGKAYVKRLKNRLRQHGFIVCMSDNVDKQNYANFNIYNEELNSVWFAEWYFTAKIPNIQETFYRKQSEFEDRLDELTSQYKQLAKAIEAKSRS